MLVEGILGGTNSLKVSPGGLLLADMPQVVRAAVAPGYRRIWTPDEIRFRTKSGNNHYRGWMRSIPADATTEYTYTYSVEGCDDLQFILAINPGSGNITPFCVIHPSAPDYATSADVYAGAAQAASGSFPAYARFSTRNAVFSTASGVRDICAGFWTLAVTGSLKELCYSVWVIGR